MPRMERPASVSFFMTSVGALMFDIEPPILHLKKSPRHRKLSVVIKIFRYAALTIIKDVVENGVEFWLPDNRFVEARMLITPEKRKRVRTPEADDDYYCVRLIVRSKRTGKERSCEVFPGVEGARKLAKMTGIAKPVVRDSKDYIKVVQEKFPNAGEHELLRIINHGFRAMRECVRFGAPVIVRNATSEGYMIIAGELYYDYWERFTNGIRDFYRRAWRMYIRMRFQDDGYRYFSVSWDKINELRDKLIAREHVHFGPVTLYKCYDMALARAFGNPFLFRVKWSESPMLRFCHPDFESSDYELIDVFHKWNPSVFMLENRTFQTRAPDWVLRRTYLANREGFVESYTRYRRELKKKWQQEHE